LRKGERGTWKKSREPDTKLAQDACHLKGSLFCEFNPDRREKRSPLRRSLKVQEHPTGSYTKVSNSEFFITRSTGYTGKGRKSFQEGLGGGSSGTLRRNPSLAEVQNSSVTATPKNTVY